MTNYNPLISVIIATKNAQGSLNRCLKSIIEQTNKNYEIIIIDGASTDNTKNIIIEYKDSIAWWESKEDEGIYHAWNKGIKKAKGKWLCFIGADDLFCNNNVFQNCEKHLKRAENINAKIIYGQAILIDKNKKKKKTIGKNWDKIGWQIKHGMPIDFPHTGMMHSYKLFKEHGFFDQSFKIAGDYEFILREIKKNNSKNILFMQNEIIVYKQEGGLSYTQKNLSILEFQKARKKNKYNSTSILWFFVYLRAIVLYHLVK
ncbi:MAG: glycosyltransferase family 2 protein [Bacillota bacterium]